MKALFITSEELKKKSIIGGNVDADKFVQFIEVAQDTHIQNYLGTKLYVKLQSLIINNTIGDAENSNYKLLLEDYVASMLVWYAQADYYAFAPFQVSNGGIFKHRSENSDSPDIKEVHMLVSRCKDTAEFYTRRFQDYMCHNDELFPEYSLIEDEEGMYPDKQNRFSDWVL